MGEYDARGWTGACIAIVGAGPFGAYALDRLAATLTARPESRPPRLRLCVFERSGGFGDGAVHHAGQMPTSYLNRICAQIGLGAGPEGEGDPIYSFVDWLAGRNEAFGLAPTSTPRRYLLGEALRELFGRTCERLERIAGISVELYPAAVTDLVPLAPPGCGYRLAIDGHAPVIADRVLLVTGHSTHSPPRGSPEERLAGEAAATDGALFLSNVNPVGDMLGEDRIPPGGDIGLAGLGLTAFDIVLALTEGRGGRFEPDPSARPHCLRYRPSGREPRTIHAYSPSGLPVTCRPLNQKVADPARLQHRPRFLTRDAIRILRRLRGEPSANSDLFHRRQLDFERDILPLLLLELGHVYHRTRLGADLPAAALEALDALVRADIGCPSAAGPERLLRALESTISPRDQLDWETLLGRRPLARDHHHAVHAAMKSDFAAALRGNLTDPGKAACDAVFRDMRPELCAVVDRGGLTPASQRQFETCYLRIYNRTSNGAAIETMSKIIALAEARLLDLSLGPDVTAHVDAERGQFILCGAGTGIRVELDRLIAARVYPFDIEAAGNELYRNMASYGLVSVFSNAGASGASHRPGGLAATELGHPVRPNGEIDRHITIMGSPLDGLRYFQNSLARPDAADPALRELAAWSTEVIEGLTADGRLPPPAARVEDHV